MQGPAAVAQVIDAPSTDLDADPEVDVIVLARGGGSVEDLLPFSDEALCRVVAAARTPIVSAIGHESDTPLVDLVADLRASTPTDAGKRVVPAVARGARGGRRAPRPGCAARSGTGSTPRPSGCARCGRRPVLADPAHLIDGRRIELDGLRDRARRTSATGSTRPPTDLAHTRARVRALSPAATLERGYAVVHGPTAPCSGRRRPRCDPGAALSDAASADGSLDATAGPAARPGQRRDRAPARATSRPARSSPTSYAGWRPAG